MIDFPVRVRSNNRVGVLIAVHFVPVSTGPQVAMDAKRQLVAGPERVELVPTAIIAVEGGFIVGPLSDVEPLFVRDDEEERESERAVLASLTTESREKRQVKNVDEVVQMGLAEEKHDA